jgi:hypothetical protein
LWAKSKWGLTEPWCPELVAAFQHQDYYNLISLLWILQVTDTASLYHAFPNWKIFIHTMFFAWINNYYEGWTDTDFLSSESFLLPISTNALLYFFPIIILFMPKFMIVYPIDNARHLFSIIWNVLFIISDMKPPIPIFPPD